MYSDWKEYTDAAVWAEEAASHLAAGIRSAVQERGTCSLGLSGGGTPKTVYERLGNASLDWKNVHGFLVDERLVPPLDERSNVHLLRMHLRTDAALHLPDTALPPEECALHYGHTLDGLLKNGTPDIVVLGIGTDGHIASLFPPLSAEAWGAHTAIHTVTERWEVRDRISVTLPVLKRAVHHVFLLQGKQKKDVWNDMMSSPEDEKRWPAKAILSEGRSTVFYCA